MWKGLLPSIPATQHTESSNLQKRIVDPSREPKARKPKPKKLLDMPAWQKSIKYNLLWFNMKINTKKQWLSGRILSCRYRIEHVKRRLKAEDVVQFTVGHISKPKPGIIVLEGQLSGHVWKPKFNMRMLVMWVRVRWRRRSTLLMGAKLRDTLKIFN